MEARSMDPALAAALVKAQRIVSPAEKTSEKYRDAYRSLTGKTL